MMNNASKSAHIQWHTQKVTRMVGRTRFVNRKKKSKSRQKGGRGSVGVRAEEEQVRPMKRLEE